jgi:hypothetical protein
MQTVLQWSNVPLRETPEGSPETSTLNDSLSVKCFIVELIPVNDVLLTETSFAQFHQFGVEDLGSASPMADVRMIEMAHVLLQQLGLDTQVTVRILGLRAPQSWCIFLLHCVL